MIRPKRPSASGHFPRFRRPFLRPFPFRGGAAGNSHTLMGGRQYFPQLAGHSRIGIAGQGGAGQLFRQPGLAAIQSQPPSAAVEDRPRQIVGRFHFRQAAEFPIQRLSEQLRRLFRVALPPRGVGKKAASIACAWGLRSGVIPLYLRLGMAELHHYNIGCPLLPAAQGGRDVSGRQFPQIQPVSAFLHSPQFNTAGRPMAIRAGKRYTYPILK